MIEIKAYAKVNLILNINGIYENRHLLDSIISQIDIYDTIRLEKNTENIVEIKYINKDFCPNNDTAFKMATLIKNNYNLSGVSISIIKNIPVGAGLGGSSADAAGVAMGMQKLFDLDVLPPQLLLQVGSDVPSMYLGGDVRIQGLGDKCTKVLLPKLYKIILLENEGVSTKASYDLYDEVGGDNYSVDEFLKALFEKKAFFVNALEKASSLLNENIAKNKALLLSCGFMSCMTGSGSAVVGYSYNKEDFIMGLNKLMKKDNSLKFILGQKE
ncbi:MAG: hypothetical protein WCR54_04150 [Clostridia bacterium]